MPPLPLEFLRHILDETEYLVSKKEGLNNETFLRDATLRDCVVIDQVLCTISAL